MDTLFVSEVRLRDNIPPQDYFAQLAVVRSLRAQPLLLEKPISLFVGENGVGKSTLIEAIAVGMGFNAEGGSRNFQFETAPTHAALYRYLTLVKGTRRLRGGFFLRAESFYNVASYVDALDDAALLHAYGGKSLHAQSHGESFLSLVRNRFVGGGLYILDEPEAALSPTSQMELLAQLHRLEQSGAQVILATHSPLLMTYPNAALYQIDEQGICRTDYRSTTHYQITRRFLDNPAQMYRLLFDTENP